MNRVQLVGPEELHHIIQRIAHEIVERNPGTEGLVLVGIKRRGVPLAQRLARELEGIEHHPIPVGAVDITLYRDDLELVAPSPIVRGSEIPFDINDKTVVLVDDVLYTGRTARAAVTELLDFGRPKKIQLAVMVDRGYRELPIGADYLGRRVQTRKDELVDVCLEEEDGIDGIFIAQRNRLEP